MLRNTEGREGERRKRGGDEKGGGRREVAREGMRREREKGGRVGGREGGRVMILLNDTVLTLVYQLVCSVVVSCQPRNHRNTQQTLESHQ